MRSQWVIGVCGHGGSRMFEVHIGQALLHLPHAPASMATSHTYAGCSRLIYWSRGCYQGFQALEASLKYIQYGLLHAITGLLNKHSGLLAKCKPKSDSRYLALNAGSLHFWACPHPEMQRKACNKEDRYPSIPLQSTPTTAIAQKVVLEFARAHNGFVKTVLQ